MQRNGTKKNQNGSSLKFEREKTGASETPIKSV